MAIDPLTSLAVASDSDLVASALAGERAAFGEIVQRYQRLLCSLAYSATGQLDRSEDLAQETFIEAWRRLGTLREPAKLRPWLCGILRFKIRRLRRDENREPLGRAEGLDAAAELPSMDHAIADEAARKEEQAILWKALERVPQSYREPLILYYREHRSVEHVATALDLSEDAVKQRLTRGRKVLQEEVLAFVEGALERSTPGRLFTAGVLAALPELTAPAKAAGLGALAAKGGALAKSTAIASFLASMSGIISGVLTLRANLDQSRTRSERRLVVKITVAAFVLCFGWIGLLWLLRAAGLSGRIDARLAATLAQVVVGGGMAGWAILLFKAMRTGRELRSAERTAHPEAFADDRDRRSGEICSRQTLFGIPLVRIRLVTPDVGTPPVVAWIAAGDRAFGLILAWGGFAVAPISVGAISVGIISVGTLALGGLAIGTAALGYIAGGVGSIGVRTFAWLSATGAQSAQAGGFAVAGNVAQAPMAWAAHADDAFAAAVLANPHEQQNALVILSAIAIAGIVPAALYARAVRNRLGPKAQHPTIRR